MKISDILGLNARSYYSYHYNTSRGKKIASSKLATKLTLSRAGVPVPDIYAKFRKPEDTLSFEWDKLPSSFALKPSKGYGGEGIIIVKKKARDGNGWITTQRKRILPDGLKLHVLDILEGAYSIGNVPDVAFIEEYVGRHKAFRKYAFRGTPDIRVIVFNKVPVLAMLRLPTKQSSGRANLHQGAIGVGVDIATGITTRAIYQGRFIRYKPGTKRKLHGIKIPYWKRMLENAIKASIATKLGYVGVDLVLHPEKGPMILEMNAFPGLQIQLANMDGLKKRLERVEDLEVKDVEHGVRIARALFAERFADQVRAEEGVKILDPIENVKVYHFKSKKGVTVKARVDTGAKRTSIDEKLAQDLGLLVPENIVATSGYKYRSATGLQRRPIIALTVRLAGRKIETTASVTDRSKMKTRLLVGRNDLSGFLVNPEEKDES